MGKTSRSPSCTFVPSRRVERRRRNAVELYTTQHNHGDKLAHTSRYAQGSSAVS
jgi:hypothetical protein